MALYGRSYTIPLYEQVVIEAPSEEEADKLFEELEQKWRYNYNIASNLVGASEARDECWNVEFADSFIGEWWGYDKPTYTHEEVERMLKEDE